MGSVGAAYDNAMGESFVSTLEREFPSRKKVASQAAAKIACFRHIEAFYGPIRRAIPNSNPGATELEAAQQLGRSGH